MSFGPLLLLLLRRRPRFLTGALTAVALIAGVATTIRSDAGLPVVIAAVAVAVLAGGRWWLRTATIVAVVAAYLVPAYLLLPAIRDHRDGRIGVNLSAGVPTSHPLWHSLYIGLGYTSNRYGIHYLDGYAAAAAQEADPGVHYLSPAYARALRKQVDALVSSAPGFVAKAEVQKVDVELAHVGLYLLLLALLLPAALAAAGPARLRLWELALFVPAVAIGALPAIVAVPFRDYESGLLGALGTLVLLAMGSAAAKTQGQWDAAQAAAGGLRQRVVMMLHGLKQAWPVRATMGTLLIAFAVLAPAFLLARHLESEHANWESAVHRPEKVVLATG
jgi:hypothetical protein